MGSDIGTHHARPAPLILMQTEPHAARISAGGKAAKTGGIRDLSHQGAPRPCFPESSP
ncbi:hypothetical protein Z947_2414 [Sulfitobacter geojensis]|nr:hypothetical protein Z947_2414 [Sulfitobacter geojensis]